jgi:hypothetical protein
MAHENTPGEYRFVRLALTEEQRAQVRGATGRDAEAIELGVQELEERIAPLNFTKISIQY